MEIPLQIAFCHVDPSADVEKRVRTGHISGEIRFLRSAGKTSLKGEKPRSGGVSKCLQNSTPS